MAGPITTAALTLASYLRGLWGCAPGGQERAKPLAAAPPHHGLRGFRNPHLPRDSRVWDFFRWRLGWGPREEPAFPPEAVPPYRPQVVAPDLPRLRSPDPSTLQVTWIGHDTFLIQVAGLNILTDPIFSLRASPFSWMGPRRQAPPGVALADLPPINAVLISHNHYDHLDRGTIQALPRQCQYFAPLGLAAWCRARGRDRVQELDWWQSAPLGPLGLISVPAQHFSMRTPWDRNRTLWCGWVLTTPAGNLYFAGCSGYNPDFREIGARYGPLRLALLPIGCYAPRWFMAPMHLNPPEAVQVHREVRSRQSIGMHWGTFTLTDEPLGEPPLYLKQAMLRAGLPPEDFTVMQLGETRVFP